MTLLVKVEENVDLCFPFKFSINIRKDEQLIGSCDFLIKSSSQQVDFEDEEGNNFHFKPNNNNSNNNNNNNNIGSCDLELSILPPETKTEPTVDYFNARSNSSTDEIKAYTDKPQTASNDLLCENQPVTRNTSAIRQRKEKLSQCAECGESFTLINLLLHQEAIHHNVEHSECNEKRKRVTRRKRRKFKSPKYIGMNGNLFPCKFCGKEFSWRDSLIAHINIHNGFKPFKCEECGKCYSRKSHLSAHLKIHAGVVYKCDDCGKVFNHKQNLVKHENNLHKNIRPFKCNKCEKGFMDKRALEAHIRSHDGIKPFQCKDCSKAFASTRSLLVHVKNHQGSKPYRCAECGNRFTTKIQLGKHFRGHKSKAPYCCCECDKSFTDRGILTRHFKSKH